MPRKLLLKELFMFRNIFLFKYFFVLIILFSYKVSANIYFDNSSSYSETDIPKFQLIHDFEINNFNSELYNFNDQYMVNYQPSGYKRGDWVKPTKFNRKLAKKAKYGDNVTIAIMDSLINCGHRNLKKTRVRSCKSLYYKRGSRTPTFRTSRGWRHGTNAAGVAAGSGRYGVAPRANILGFAVFDDKGWYVKDNQFYNYVKIAVGSSYKAKVLNWSFGANNTRTGRTIPLGKMETVGALLAKNKALVVKAAGNGNKKTGKGQYFSNGKYIHNKYKSNLLSKVLDNLIWVGALNYNGKKRASWSDMPGNGCFRGKSERKCTKKNQYKYFFIYAPGYVRTTDYNGSYNNTQGTSFAAPIVGGAAALIQSRWTKLKPHQIRNILLKTATDMGRKGVDPVYGRGKLNLYKALKPIRGKVGGVRTGKSINLYNRLGSSVSFNKEPTIYDEFDRDFQATNYSFSDKTSSTLVSLHENNDIPININFSFTQNDDGSFSPFINNFSYDGISYFPSYVDNTEWNRFDAQSSSFYIPPTLSQLIEGNAVIGLNEENLMMFAAVPSKDTINPTSPHAFGVTHKSSFDNGLMMSNTIGTMKENGFFGLNSIDRFGFDKEMTNIFFISDFNNNHKSLDYGFRFESYVSPNSYDSDVISWSNLSLSKISLDIGHNWDKQRFGITIKSPLQTYGNFSSNIEGLEKLGDFYNEDATVQISYQSHQNDNKTINTKVSSDDGGTLHLNYELKF